MNTKNPKRDIMTGTVFLAVGLLGVLLPRRELHVLLSPIVSLRGGDLAAVQLLAALMVVLGAGCLAWGLVNNNSGGKQVTREEIQEMVGFNDIELKQTRFYQQAVSEGEATLLLHQLERRFGPLSAEVRRRVAAAGSETLLVWGERLLEAKTLADIWGD